MLLRKKSLFDRILDASKTDHQYLDESAYMNAIFLDIGELLNTRCILPYSRRQTDLPLNYGLPYMFGMEEPDDMLNPNQQDEWRKMLEKTLRYFEPRLLNPKVKILNINTGKQMISIQIKGKILFNNDVKEIHFPFTLYNTY